MINFITHRQKPNECPKCFSNNVGSFERKHYCFDCEFEWSSPNHAIMLNVIKDN
jgi:hypothetical protein